LSATKSTRRKRPEAKVAAAEPAGDRLGRYAIGPGVTIRSLEIFTAVAKSGSMVAAAKQLDLTQPAISQVIGALEANLGIELFDRSVRPPALTLQGATLIRHAVAITDAIEKFHGAVRLGTSAQLPLLRIGMLNSFAATMGPHVIKRLRDVAVQWSVDSGFGATRIRAVSEREFDFVVTSDETPVPPDVEVMPILTEPFLMIVPSSFRDSAVTLRSLSEGLDLIRFGRDPHLHARIDGLLQREGLIPQRRYHLDTTEAVLAMVADGSGWTILPPLPVFASLARGAAIRALRLPGKSFQRRIVVASRKGEGHHIATQIRDAAVAALSQHYLPKVRGLMPHIADQLRLHGVSL
jgi:DNA-binding transcriptional LysR family regulator